jgi:hypothetical protein
MNNHPIQEMNTTTKARRATNQQRKENPSNRVLFQEIER